jgi:hypothetical protein
MVVSKSSVDKILYELKIVLRDIKPEIWRNFVVPANIPLDRLHDVIQIVMGWTETHIHRFEISGKKYTEEPESEQLDGQEEGRVRLGELVRNKGDSFLYVYDFGDNWRHDVILVNPRHRPDYSDARTMIEGVAPVECLGGARACPPEDVGSVDGYELFCEAIGDPGHEEHYVLRQWYAGLQYHGGDNYDSERFNLEIINTNINRYIRYCRKRYIQYFLVNYY